MCRYSLGPTLALLQPEINSLSFQLGKGFMYKSSRRDLKRQAALGDVWAWIQGWAIDTWTQTAFCLYGLGIGEML